LIAENLGDYERLARTLAEDPARLGSYRRHLEDRATLALFDTARTTRHIEAAYEEMMARWTRGEKPAGFAVTAG
jgi:predicted O-linked N-acetylglucosamine transferase (SPINDLY family)